MYALILIWDRWLGFEAVLVCESEGGRPTPSVDWYIGPTLIQVKKITVKGAVSRI